MVNDSDTELRDAVKRALNAEKRLEGCRQNLKVTERWLEAYRRYVIEIGARDIDRILDILEEIEGEEE